MEDLRYQLDLMKAMNQKLSDTERMYRLLCETSEDAFLYYSFETNRYTTLGNWSQFFDFKVEKARDIQQLFDVIEDEYMIPVRDAIYIEKKKLKKISDECRLKDRKTWLQVNVYITYNEAEEPEEKLIRFRNVTKSKGQNDELVYMTYYDLLTGLYNRNYFVKLLGEFVRKAYEEKSIVSVMYMDLDDFKKINDGMELIVADEIVQQFGQFLATLSSEDVIVCHMYNDVYAIAIYNPCGTRSVEHIYHAIQERLKNTFLLSTGQEITITVSIGVAEYPEATKSALELINCAEIVMYKAKSLGKNLIQYFESSILQDFLENVTIENKLKEAVFQKNFMLHFQPQYYISNNRLRGVEALIRWKDEDGKMISPNVFIPIAERNGAIIPIGTWVLEESIRNFANWKKQYSYPMIMSINISAIQYKKSNFVSQLLEFLHYYEVKPQEIELEITESILIDDFKKVTEKLCLLREYGIRVALDDFGTGFSSLAYLKGLPIDTLKIDKSFIDTVLSDKSTQIIIESIITMVKNLGYEVIAEGVEEKAQYEYLKSVHCDIIQGYYLGKPMEADRIQEILKKSKSEEAANGLV